MGPVRRTHQHSGHGEYTSRDIAPRIIWHEFGSVTAPDRQARRFQPTTASGRHVRVEDVQCCSQLASGAVELTVLIMSGRSKLVVHELSA